MLSFKEYLIEQQQIDEGIGDWVYKKLDGYFGAGKLDRNTVKRLMASAPKPVNEEEAAKYVEAFLLDKKREALLQQAAEAQQTTVEKLKPFLLLFVGEFIDRWKKIPAEAKRRVFHDLAMGIVNVILFILKALVSKK